MIKDKRIFIKNIYYMLSYAFQILKQSNYDEVASEKFDNAQDLFAAILSKGIAQQLKQGLYREYITKNETLSVMRGKLDMPETIRNRIQRKQKLACEFDELSENNLLNQILKTTIHYLLIDDGVDFERKVALKKLLVFFDGIEQLDPSEIPWSRIHYQRNSKNYELLINVCYFVLDGMLQTTEKGEYKMAAFSDDHMARLYEKFILEYYHQHHTYLTEVKAGQVKWDLVGENSESMIRFLPVMQTDIMLRLKDKILIIDAKYYGRTLQKQFDKYSLHSGNVYQIFTYVKNQDKDNTGNVAGVLLYAKTDEDITPDCMFNMGGNQIGAKTLDLNKEFPLIAAQLDKLAEDYFCNNSRSSESDLKKNMEASMAAPGNDFVQNGDNNTMIGYVNNMNMIIGGTHDTDASHHSEDAIEIGGERIDSSDAALLAEFKSDYDDILLECIKTDFTAPWVRIELHDDIENRYQQKWDVQSLKFKNKALRSIVFATLESLSNLTIYLTDKYMRAVNTPQGFVLIARNESWEEGNQLRDELRPETMKIRFKLRDLYRELHPEEYKDVPGFEDSYEKYCEENGITVKQ